MRKNSSGPKRRKPVPASFLMRKHRNDRGISQAEAARQIGVSGPTIHDWESGTKRPRQDKRPKIEAWSDGEIPASLWEYPDERIANDIAEAVAGVIKRTGTDGSR